MWESVRECERERVEERERGRVGESMWESVRECEREFGRERVEEWERRVEERESVIV